MTKRFESNNFEFNKRNYFDTNARKMSYYEVTISLKDYKVGCSLFLCTFLTHLVRIWNVNGWTSLVVLLSSSV